MREASVCMIIYGGATFHLITAIFYPLFPVSTWHQGLLLADTNSFATKFESGTAAGVKTVCAFDESRPISFASSKTDIHDAFVHHVSQHK